MAATRTVRLSDGRTIGFEDFGDPEGLPVLFFHGTPGSRLYWELVGPGNAAADAGMRVISTDRPGLGLSSPEPQRSIGSFAFDVAQLVDALEVERFGVLGFSGGAPYALAAAAFMPDRVSAVSIVSPMADLSAPGLLDSIDDRLRKAISFATESRTARASAVAELLGADKVVHTIADHMWAQLPPADRAALMRPSVREAAERMLSEAARQGIEGARLDIDLMTRKWDFPVEDITAPVSIVAGGHDPWSPRAMSDWLLGMLPHASLVTLPSDGHFTPIVRHGCEILGELRESMREADQPLLGQRDHEAITSSANAI